MATPDRFALLVGGMKCGTDSLFAHLSQHPEVCPSTRKEPNFFADDDHWARGAAWYLDHWAWDDERHAVALEGSTGYTKRPAFPSAAPRIARFAKERDVDVRILYLVRDPVARAESHATHELTERWGLDRPQDEPVFQGRWLAESMYAKQLEPYVEHLGMDRIRVLDLEDLERDPEQLLRDVCTFLDVDAEFAFTGLDEVHNPSADRMVKGPIWRALDAVGLTRHATLLPTGLRRTLRRQLGRPVGGKVRLSAEQREFLLHALREDLRSLQERHGVDVSRWGIELDP